MNILNEIKSMLVRDRAEPRFSYSKDSSGLIFHAEASNYHNIKEGNASSWALHQYVYLKILEEQGEAERIPNGFILKTEAVCRLETRALEILDLPGRFYGSFLLKSEGLVESESFGVELVPILEDGTQQPYYEINGPFLQLTNEEKYLLTGPQFMSFSALERHQSISRGSRREDNNLGLIATLQQAKEEGMKINLRHFERLEIKIPESIGVTAIEQESGSLALVPSFGTDDRPTEICNRLHQVLDRKCTFATLRVGKQIILLDEERLKAVHDIIANRNIEKEQVAKFLQSPSAYLDAKLVNLDLGFSLRVHGAVEFRHGYFGSTDESGISWFESQDNVINAPIKLLKKLETKTDITQFEEQYNNAVKTGADQLKLDGEIFDISDRNHILEIIDKAKNLERDKRTSKQINCSNELECKSGKNQINVGIDIALNDEELDFCIGEDIASKKYDGEIDYAKYLRMPFKYQEEGIRWILGWAKSTINLEKQDAGKHGVLLADDMGLGKTFMSLVAIKEYMRIAEEHDDKIRPVMVVAPLGLLENWIDEIKKTYGQCNSPFNSTVILHPSADLKRFRLNAGTETCQDEAIVSGIAKIKYCLKIGSGSDRLDMYKRLVLTTYETLRDYQFSLASIDWSIVIFDEAQLIKNPNTQKTRAAKGLKSRFKILITGTPVENSLADFWCLMDTAIPGYLRSYQEFRRAYMLPITQAPYDEISKVRYDVGKRLRKDVGPTMLRRIKEDELDGLPKKCIYTGDINAETPLQYKKSLACEMQEGQRKKYETVIELVHHDKKSLSKSGAALAGLRNLQSITLHPALLEKGQIPIPNSIEEACNIISQSGKLKCVFKLLEKIKMRDEKVIIFAISKNLQSFLAIALQIVLGISANIINGDVKALSSSSKNLSRKEYIKEFEEKQGFGVIVMSPIAAGVGLNVIGANNVIHLERHWNPAKEAQATDRVYRIGQKKTVNIYIPILKHPNIDSFDVNLNQLINQKTALKNSVVTPEEVDPSILTRMSFGGEVKFDSTMTKDLIDPSTIKDMGWEKFEAFAAELIAASVDGSAQLTASGTDSGADALVFAESGNIILQAKKSKIREINKDAAAEVYRAKPLYEKALGKRFTRLIAITNANKFSRRVRRNAKTYKVELFTMSEIKKILEEYPIEERKVLARLNKDRVKI